VLPDEALLVKVDRFAFHRQQYHARRNRRYWQLAGDIAEFSLPAFLRDPRRYSVAAEETPRRRPVARSPMLDRTDDISI
jgi:hypothetical protein